MYGIHMCRNIKYGLCNNAWLARVSKDVSEPVYNRFCSSCITKVKPKNLNTKNKGRKGERIQLQLILEPIE